MMVDAPLGVGKHATSSQLGRCMDELSRTKVYQFFRGSAGLVHFKDLLYNMTRRSFGQELNDTIINLDSIYHSGSQSPDGSPGSRTLSRTKSFEFGPSKTSRIGSSLSQLRRNSIGAVAPLNIITPKIKVTQPVTGSPKSPKARRNSISFGDLRKTSHNRRDVSHLTYTLREYRAACKLQDAVRAWLKGEVWHTQTKKLLPSLISVVLSRGADIVSAAMQEDETRFHS